MANIIANWAPNDSGITDTSLQSSKYLSYSKLSGPIVDKISTHVHSKSYDELKFNYFKILHQNIRGLFQKTDEFLTSVTQTSPQVLCFTEHHLRAEELENINLAHTILWVHNIVDKSLDKVVSQYTLLMISNFIPLTLIILAKRNI